MRILSVEAENFLSYKSLSYSVDTRGVVLVTGANGSGKSAALVDAPAWCFFGRTVRGLSGDGVIHDPTRTGKAKGATVRVRMIDDDGTEHVVQRFRKYPGGLRNRVLVDDEWHGTVKAADEAIVRLIGLRWETFCVAAIFGQGLVSRFSSAGDSERKRILDEMLGLERIEEARKRCSAELSTAKTGLDTAKRAAADNTAWAASLGTSIEEAERNEAHWAQARLERANNATTQVNAAEAAVAAATTDYSAELAAAGKASADLEESYAAEVTALRVASAAAGADLSRAHGKSTAAAVVVHAGVAKLQEHERHLSQLRRALDSFAADEERVLARLGDSISAVESATSFDPRAAVCPACSVNIAAAVSYDLLPHAMVDSADAAAAARVAVAQDVMAANMANIGLAQANVSAAQEQLTAAEASFDTDTSDEVAKKTYADAQAAQAAADAGATVAQRALQSALFNHSSNSLRQAARSEVSRLQQAIAAAEGAKTASAARLSGAIQHLQSIQAETNPHEAATGTLVSQRAERLDNAAAAEVTADHLQTEIDGLAFWQQAFGPAGIRSLLYDEVLPALNRAARRYSKALSGGRMTVYFNTEAELKGGGTRDKFGATTTLDIGAGSYEACSGGWRQRSDLVQLFALRSAVASRTGGLGLLVLDEALTYVDTAGVEAAAALVKEVAQDVGTVFLCTHDVRLQSEFSTTAHVDYEGGVSTLREGSV